MAYSSGVYELPVKTVWTAHWYFSRQVHLLITYPFYTQKTIFQGKGHLLKKLPPVQYACSVCYNGHAIYFVSKISGDRCKLISCYFCLLAFWKSLCPLSASVPCFDHNIILLKKVKCRCISLSKFSIWVKIFQIFLIPCVFSLNKMEVSNIEQTKIQILFVHFETAWCCLSFSIVLLCRSFNIFLNFTSDYINKIIYF